ncbi:MAG: hypothetical protein QNJ29_03385 [Rhizobiaceae bacterium]|nr:hypothetical protein [Rhizobiaceae bacterium]
MKIISAFIFLLTGFLGFTAQSAATVPHNTLQHTCETRADYFAINSINYRSEDPDPTKNDTLFFHSEGRLETDGSHSVVDCQVAGMDLKLVQVFLHKPDNSGAVCATSNWSVFQLTADGKVISEFVNGCSTEIHVFTNRHTIHVCKSSFDHTECKTVLWQDIADAGFQPLRIGLLGNWL